MGSQKPHVDVSGFYYIPHHEHEELRHNRVQFVKMGANWYDIYADVSRWKGVGQFNGRFYTGIFRYDARDEMWGHIAGRHYMERTGWGFKVFGINEIGHSGFFFFDLIKAGEDEDERYGASIESESVGGDRADPRGIEHTPASDDDVPEEAGVGSDSPGTRRRSSAEFLAKRKTG